MKITKNVIQELNMYQTTVPQLSKCPKFEAVQGD